MPTGGCFWIYLDYLKTRKGIRRYSRVSKVNLIWPLIIRGKLSWVPVWVDDSDYWRIALPNSGIKCVLVQYLNTLMEQQLRARGCHTSPWWWYNKLSALPNCFHPKLITVRQKNRVVLLANIKECSIFVRIIVKEQEEMQKLEISGMWSSHQFLIHCRCAGGHTTSRGETKRG